MTIPLWFRALGAQLGALLLAYGIFGISGLLGSLESPWPFLAFQGVLAAGLSLPLGLPRWWLPIEAAFLPTVVFVLSLQIPPPVFLGSFLILWLIYRSNTSERVPLYLSNRATWRALGVLSSEHANPRFLDLGSGLGGTLHYLALCQPKGEFQGVESAPLPYLISRLRLLGTPNARVRLGDLWREDLSQYDVIYAFLSPEPMPALWDKVRAEMRAGSILVSNTFEIPGVAPSRVWQLDDRRRTRLLIFEMDGRDEPGSARGT